jgi:hypothetical protein
MAEQTGYPDALSAAAAAARLVFIGICFTTPSDSKTAAYTAPPMIGASQNNHSWATAHPPTKIAGPVLRAGFTDKFDRNPDQMKAPIMINRKKNVSTTSATKHESSE